MTDIHGTGRCTCGGEGRCAWCQEICDRCQGDGWDTLHLDTPCRHCNGTGYADGLKLTMDERAAKVAAIRADEPDYEALGYTETEIRVVDLSAYYVVAGNIGMLAAGWAASVVIACESDAIQKDIRSDTDST